MPRHESRVELLLLLHRRMHHEDVVAVIPAALQAGALTVGAVAF